MTVGATLAGIAQGQPNILIIVTDDQRLDGTMAWMPKTTKWFKRGDLEAGIVGGTEFSNASASTPLCCPSRASIFTGQYAHRHKVLTNKPEHVNMLDHRTTLQYYLQREGYRTAIYGKYLNNWPIATNPYYFSDWAILNTGRYSPTHVNEGGVRKWIWDYSTNYVARKAEEFLDRAHTDNAQQPWFLYIAPETPHGPYFPEQKYAHATVPEIDQDRNTYFEEDRRDKPPWVQTLIGSPAGGVGDQDAIENDWKEHLRMLMSTDDLVERVMQKLASIQEEEDDQDTLAFFTSDNGFLWGEHGLREKIKPYLEAIEVPFFVRWPDHQIGVWPFPKSDSLVANIDIAPTALEAAGIDPSTLNSPLDGRSLIDATPQPRTRSLTESWAPTASPATFPQWRALHTRTFHYIEYYEDDGVTPRRWPSGPLAGKPVREYYDLVNDPTEEHNLLGDGDPRNDPPTDGQPGFDRDQPTLHAQLEADRTCRGVGGLLPDDPPNTPPPSSCPNREEFGPPQEGRQPFPVDTGISQKPDPVSSGDVTFSFSATEPNSTFRCKLQSEIDVLPKPYRSCAATTKFTGLRDVRHTLTVVATAGQGLSVDPEPETYSWRVDNATPDTRLTQTPMEPLSRSTSATFRFEGSNAVAFECRLDDRPPDMNCGTGTGGEKTVAYSDLLQGSHTFTVTAYNPLTPGVRDPTPPSYTWSIDSIPPETEVLPAGELCSASQGPIVTCPGQVHDTSATLYPNFNPNSIPNWTPEPIERFQCSLDGAEYAVCSGTKTYTRLERGWHTVDVKATDLAGNTDGSPAKLRWEVGTRETFNSAPDTQWPQITEGTQVRAIVPDGLGGWYVGGDFTRVGSSPGADSGHTDLVHIDKYGTVDDTWNPATDTGEVRAMVADGGSLYIGGTFTGVRGNADSNFTTRRRLAAIDISPGPSRGRVIAGWDPNVMPIAGTEVNAMALGKRKDGENTVYAAGAFDSVHEAAHRNVVELNVTDGSATNWSPNIGGPGLLALEVTSQTDSDCGPGNCGYVYVGGYGNVLAEIDRATGETTTWSPSPDGTVNALELRYGFGRLPTIYVGGPFTRIGTPAETRNHAAEINLTDRGTVTSWDPSVSFADGRWAAALAFMPFHCDKVFAGVTYFAGDFARDTPCATIVGGAFDTLGPSPVPTHSRLGETDRISGGAHEWNPNLDRAVYALACYPTFNCQTSNPPNTLAGNRILAVGGAFNNVGGQGRKGLAFFCRFGSVNCRAPAP